MDFPQFAHTVGLALPTPAYLIGLVLFGLVGMLAWAHGKRSRRPTTKWLGLALMLYPYAVPQTWLLYAAGTALTAWVAWSWRR
ncbi:hypothetical protein [Ramlibacter sp.]|uniref:hypothetical protein n=1 Tax=Ramlibacter sp. TaxID=1917967 RepID=UPI002B583622|nr:hypothetical protein [Ramlibacter sp.]HWI80432.1 hypothetical protein [Ramlibacter sp.]